MDMRTKAQELQYIPEINGGFVICEKSVVDNVAQAYLDMCAQRDETIELLKYLSEETVEVDGLVIPTRGALMARDFLGKVSEE